MNLDLYVATLERTAENLPDVAAEWDALADDLAMHYLEELSLLVAGAEPALKDASRDGRYKAVDRICRALCAIREVAEAYSALGIRPSEVGLKDASLSSGWTERELQPPDASAIAA